MDKRTFYAQTHLLNSENLVHELLHVFAKFDEDGYVHVTSTGPQGSHQLAATSIANALAMVEDGQGVYAGDRLEVMLLSDWS